MNNEVTLGALALWVAMLLELGVQAVPRSITSGTFFSEDLVMKLFLRSFFLFVLIQEEQLSVKSNGEKNLC